MTLPPLYLKRREERRLRLGHLWVYSNEVDVARSPLKAYAPGDAVALHAYDGRFIGNGYVNPHSLICARLVTRNPDHQLGKSLLVHRLNVAVALRSRCFAEPYYRLVYGESDGLPGLIVDRYADVLAVQVTTAGMERVRDALIDALVQVLRPAAILLLNDTPTRTLEGLDRYVQTALGSVPEVIRLQENGAVFEVPLGSGQKTGWFFNQRMNRARFATYAREARVLDVFSYSGSWGIQAAVHGAREVHCVDASERAVASTAHNAALNGVAGRVVAQRADGFDALKALRAGGERFGVIALDPPAFIKRKKDFKAGLEAYQRLNQSAMLVLEKDGLLVTSSCSYHLPRATFLDALYKGALAVDRQLQIIEQGHQGPDHPIHPAIAETEYLKTFFLRVLPR